MFLPYAMRAVPRSVRVEWVLMWARTGTAKRSIADRRGQGERRDVTNGLATSLDLPDIQFFLCSISIILTTTAGLLSEDSEHEEGRGSC